MKFTIIGIDDNRKQEFKREILDKISQNCIFSGGKRHYEIVKPYLPINHTWINITVPLKDIFEKYKSFDRVVIFASGDPFFFGFGTTIKREFTNAEIELYPYFNSLQQLAHKMLISYQDMHTVSLTGRDWDKFDEALILGYNKLGVLTDRQKHTPFTIAQRMKDYGYTNYTMTIGELLGNTEKEKFSTYSINEITSGSENITFQYPNNIILQIIDKLPRPLGIDEKDFNFLNGRSKMITKMPIRLLSLSYLDLRDKETFWDIGFCTGSVSIEAKMQFPHLKVISFEKREEGRKLMEDNSRKFHTPGIKSVIGDFTHLNMDDYPLPDAIFIGGHGGKMMEIFDNFMPYLKDKGCIVFNSVSDNSYNLFMRCVEKYNLSIKQDTAITIDNFNLIHILKAEK